MNDIETRLSATLRSAAANTHAEDRLQEVFTHTAKVHHPNRQLFVAVAAFAVVVGALGPLFLLTRGGERAGDTEVSSASTVTGLSSTAAAVSPPTTPNGDPWPLPRLAIDTDLLDTELVFARARSEFTAADAALAGSPLRYLQVLRTDADIFEPPMIWIETDDNGSDYLRSGTAREQADQELIIDGTVFFLTEDGDRGLLTAELPGGASVLITGLGVEATDLIDLASEMNPTVDGPGWDVPDPPLGLQVVFEGRPPDMYDPPGNATQAVQWLIGAADVNPLAERQDPGVDLILENRGRVNFERRLYELAGQATDANLVRTGRARNQPAAVIGLSDLQIAVWRETDEATAMLAVGSVELPMEQFLGSLIEVDEATWQAMEQHPSDLTPTPTTAPPADGELVSPPTTIPIAETEREAKEYSIRLAILDGVASVDGSGVDAQFRDAALSALNRRCSALPNGLESGSLDGTTPAHDTANQILSSLNCQVSTMAVTIKDDGTASGVIAVLDPKAVDQIQQAVGEGIWVQVDHAD